MYKSRHDWLYITISIAGELERHKGLTIVINIDLPRFQIVKKLAVINWNKPHKFRRRGRVADCTGLENRSWGILVASSNLAVSSI